MLNNESGLLGLSDLSNDMRTLEQEREQGHPGAALAIEVFCYRLAKSLAAMSCALPQLDGVIFTGGIGDLFCDLLLDSRFRFTRAPGTYFQCVDYSAVRPDLDDVAMAEWLTREHGVAAIPVSVFYEKAPDAMRLVRFCYAKREETLRQAAEKLCAI